MSTSVGTRESTSNAPAEKPRKITFASRFRRDGFLVALGIPGILAILIFSYIALAGNIIAFQEFQPYLGVLESPFNGVANFSFLWGGNQEFLNALYNTLMLTLIQTVLVFPVPLVIALVLNSLVTDWLKRLLQSILYLPHFLSWVIVVAIFQQVLGNAGMMNTFFAQQGWSPVHIIGVPELFKVLVTSQAIWKDAGWGTIIFLAALSRVDPEQYEASAVDGANGWQRLWHITLPALKGLFILLLILRLGNSLSTGFEQIFLQQGPVGRQASEVLDTWVYNYGIIGGNWGMSAAVGLFKSVVGVALVIIANKLAHAVGEQGVYGK